MNEKQTDFLFWLLYALTGLCTGYISACILDPQRPHSMTPTIFSCLVLGFLFVEVILIGSHITYSWHSFVFHICLLVGLTYTLWHFGLAGDSFLDFAKLYCLTYWYEFLRVTVLQFIYARRDL